MAKEFTYTVTGTGGRFPIDMLRYDGARPRQSEDSRKIEGTLENRHPREHGVEVQLVGMQAPTIDRWRSFGWIVSEIDSRKVAA